MCFFSSFSSFTDEKRTRLKYYNKQTTTRDNDNAPSHEQDVSENNKKSIQ